MDPKLPQTTEKLFNAVSHRLAKHPAEHPRSINILHHSAERTPRARNLCHSAEHPPLTSDLRSAECSSSGFGLRRRLIHMWDHLFILSKNKLDFVHRLRPKNKQGSDQEPAEEEDNEIEGDPSVGRPQGANIVCLSAVDLAERREQLVRNFHTKIAQSSI